MAATKTKKKPAAKKRSHKKKVPPKGAIPKPFDDTTTQEDEQATPGRFVEVVNGPHEGRYGSLDDVASDNEVIVTTRDAARERLVVKWEDCRNAEAGRR